MYATVRPIEPPTSDSWCSGPHVPPSPAMISASVSYQSRSESTSSPSMSNRTA